MVKHVLKTMVAVLAIAAAATGPVMGQSTYNVIATVANTTDARGTISASYTNNESEAKTAGPSTNVTFTALGASTTTLVATPAAGYHFVNWTNGATIISTNDTLTTTEALVATANFDTTHAELAWDTDAFTGYSSIDFNNWKPTLTNPNGVEVRYGYTKAPGTMYNLSIDAQTGVIGLLSARGYVQSMPGTYTVYAVHDLSQEYFYDSVAYTLTIEYGAIVSLMKNIDEAGVVSFSDYTTVDTLTYAYVDEHSTAIIAHGNDVAIEAEPDTGYHFVSWEAGNLQDGYTAFATTADTVYTVPNAFGINLRANFDTNVYNVVAAANIDGLGTVTGAGQVKHFHSTTLVATANPKYHFVHWIDTNNNVVSTKDTLEIIPVSDTILTAVFDTNLYATVWSGSAITSYTSQPYTGFSATYTDYKGIEHTPVLTFVCGDTTITTPNYPVTAGNWQVTAIPEEGDSLLLADTILVIKRAVVFVSDVVVETAKFADGIPDAVVSDMGILNNVQGNEQGNDAVTHTTIAYFSDAEIGEGKIITVYHGLNGSDELLANYELSPTSETYDSNGYIIEPMVPNTDRPENDTTVIEQGFDVRAYGYCSGDNYHIRYHLNSGTPDQYKLAFTNSSLTAANPTGWVNLATPGTNGIIDIIVPVDLPMGDYVITVTFRDSRFTWLESNPMPLTFHVNLPQTFTMPLFNNVIALVDTCHCFSDIQWYHRANATDEWQAIPGATGYYYHATDAELQGEFFVKAKFNGVETYTCPQTDMETLYTDDEQTVSVKAYPNPTTDGITVTVNGSTEWIHTLRVLSTVGVVMENRTFEGVTTSVDMRSYPNGTYMVIVDGVVVRVVRN